MMTLTHWIGRALGYRDVTDVESVRLTFGAEWAHDGPAWVLFGCLALCALSFAFYLRCQHRGHRGPRLLLAAVRAFILCLLLVVLADPILEIKLTSHPKPVLWVLLDGTDSMNIADQLPEEERERLENAVDAQAYEDARNAGFGMRKDAGASDSALRTPDSAFTRADFVRALLHKPDDNLLAGLAEKYRLRGYVLGSSAAGREGIRAVELTDEDGAYDAERLQDALTTDGQVTALGSAFEELALRQGTGNVAGLLVVSDFDWNAGPVPLTAAEKLKLPVYTLGVGPRSAADLSVMLLADPTMKKGEASTVELTLEQKELEGHPVFVRVVALPADEDADGEPVIVGEREVTLEGPLVPVSFTFTPADSGRFTFVAEVGRRGGGLDEQGLATIVPLDAETATENNAARREVSIIDDFMRLLYVEYEPTWEWRFIKEVFHRDELVGLRGFRTFLRSSDPRVREENELFVPTPRLPRSEFFKYDVIFLGDMPASALSTGFCEMTREFVRDFGGGLVVIAGPRFGPGELAGTPLADMLPVVVDPDARIREQEFRLQMAPAVRLADHPYDFMRLGTTEEETAKAWDNLGPLAWYQPVRHVYPINTTVLAEHPTDVCMGDERQTRQPLIAIRKYGRGEVIYVGFNETWRLRRKYGEKYYRNFWGPMIKRLGLSHALGAQKRFVVATDQQRYRADDKVVLSVEAYDENFEPLSEEEIPDRTIAAELIRPGRDELAATRTTLAIAQKTPGRFETQIPVYEPGEYRLRVTDPITGETTEKHFQVTNVSAERRSAVRNYQVQQALATETGGKAYELDTIGSLLTDLDAKPLTETTVDIFPIWSTWLFFVPIVGLMLLEWFARKLVNLA